jgi:hypothetical protein
MHRAWRHDPIQVHVADVELMPSPMISIASPLTSMVFQVCTDRKRSGERGTAILVEGASFRIEIIRLADPGGKSPLLHASHAPAVAGQADDEPAVFDMDLRVWRGCRCAGWRWRTCTAADPRRTR